MSTFIFIYLGSEITIPCKQKEDIKQIIHRFCIKVGANKENLNFLCNGKILDENITEDKIPMNENGTKIIIVFDNEQNNNSQDIIIKSNVIICPQCKECASLSIDNYHLTISNCKNGHIKNINIEDFAENQKINISQIICEQCKNKNMGNAEGHLFFRCIECKKNLCILCKSGHNPNHNIINYSNKYYTCAQHGEPFISYCSDCKCNLCFICEENHNNHNVQTFRKLFNESKNKLNEELIKLRENINIMKQKINDFVNICNKVVESYEILYNIKKDIYENINLKQRNIQNWNNQKFINNEINDDIEIIIKELNNNYNFTKLLSIYKQINKYQKYILIKYKIEKNETRIKIFDKTFVENNAKHCKIIYDNTEHVLSDYVYINEIKDIRNNIFEIKLLDIKNISNACCMFNKCPSLIFLPDISEWDTINIINMNFMFRGCSLLTSLPDISKWNTSNVTSMTGMFLDCYSFQSLPDISKWNVGNVTSMNCMFSGCSSLKSLPDISNWDISKLNDIGYIFAKCSLLQSLPDISKWDTSKITNLSGLFEGCYSLLSLPDISKWNTSNAAYTVQMFKGCFSLKSLPEISNWDITNVKNMNGMFTDCSTSIIIPKKFQK